MLTRAESVHLERSGEREEMLRTSVMRSLSPSDGRREMGDILTLVVPVDERGGELGARFASQFSNLYNRSATC